MLKTRLKRKIMLKKKLPPQLVKLNDPTGGNSKIVIITLRTTSMKEETVKIILRNFI